ncbi:hypothetical protein AB0L59_15225 [Streptomyces sp. NPDC052109]|uniref:3-hydroxyacyl-ACP dehydratase FabZ family protein n=1 Tax=Streptomyces sp. NPDC052109 TaxID=3155527 RepID=UPI003440717B
MTATPLTTPVELVRLEDADPLTVTTRVVVDHANPVFAGHYPGFPIFPGVCLIECAHHSVLLAAHARGCEPALAAVRGTRFLSPAFPGDTLDLTVRVTPEAGFWECDARISRAAQDIARIRLRYAQPGDDA